MLLVPDPFDPRFLDFGDQHEYKIYGDDHALTFARVDQIDYQWAVRWRWNVTFDKHGKKPYFRITVSETGRPDYTVYLHVEIQKRKGEPQPPHHTISDHLNGDSSDCRRFNLGWATPSMNRRNIFGQGYMKL